MKTHRCEKSLENKVSIRYSREFNSLKLMRDSEAWRMFVLKYDGEYDVNYLTHVSKIKYCPFCAVELK